MKDWNHVKCPAEPLRSQAAAVLFCTQWVLQKTKWQ